MHEPNTTRAHACFRLDIRFPINLGDHGVDHEAELFDLWHNLSYRVMRRPDDLLAHTRRIRLCQEPALQAKLPGALMDLDYVLGDRGANLRQRLRAECEHALQQSATTDNGSVLPTMQFMIDKATRALTD